MKRRSPLPTAKSDSIWAATAKLPVCRRLSADVTCDVCIVGAGIAGLTTGYLLTQGRQARRHPRRRPAGQRHDPGHHRPPVQRHRRPLHRTSSAGTASDGARLAAQSHAAAIDRIEVDRRRAGRRLRLPAASTATCSARRTTAKTTTCSNDELAAAQRAGVRGAEIDRRGRRSTASTPGPACGFPIRRGSTRSSTSPPWPRRSRSSGGRIFTNSHVDRIEGGDAGEGHGRRLHRHRRRRRRRHEHADQRPGGDPHQAGAVHDLRHRLPRAARLGRRRALLGHARTPTTTSGCSRSKATPAQRRSDDVRPADRRRRRPQVGPGRRRRRAARPAAAAGPASASP